MSNKTLIKADQLAKNYNVSVRTIRQWQADGIIPFVKVSRAVRFCPEKVADALESFEIKAFG